MATPNHTSPRYTLQRYTTSTCLIAPPALASYSGEQSFASRSSQPGGVMSSQSRVPVADDGLAGGGGGAAEAGFVVLAFHVFALESEAVGDEAKASEGSIAAKP